MIKHRCQMSDVRCQIFLFLIFCFLFSTAGGCGYTTRSMISDKYKTIYITPFVNKIDITREDYVANKYRIYRPQLETDVTRLVSNKYLFDGNLKPVRPEAADLVLKGELLEFRKDPVRYDDNNEVTEYRINLVVNISMLDRKAGNMLWEEKNFTGDTTFFTSFHPVAAERKEEATAVNDAIADLARRIVERTVEQW